MTKNCLWHLLICHELIILVFKPYFASCNAEFFWALLYYFEKSLQTQKVPFDGWKLCELKLMKDNGGNRPVWLPVMQVFALLSSAPPYNNQLLWNLFCLKLMLDKMCLIPSFSYLEEGEEQDLNYSMNDLQLISGNYLFTGFTVMLGSAVKIKVMWSVARPVVFVTPIRYFSMYITVLYAPTVQCKSNANKIWQNSHI